jgi:hypothetical protein
MKQSIYVGKKAAIFRMGTRPGKKLVPPVIPDDSQLMFTLNPSPA